MGELQGERKDTREGWRGLKGEETGSSLHFLARSSCGRPSKTPKSRRKPETAQVGYLDFNTPVSLVSCISFQVHTLYVLRYIIYTKMPAWPRLTQGTPKPHAPCSLRVSRRHETRELHDPAGCCRQSIAPLTLRPGIPTLMHSREQCHAKASPTSFPASIGWLRSR